MNDIQPVNRRKEDRIPTNGNVYVVLDTTPPMMGQMVEISSKGLSFTFVDLESISKILDDRKMLRLALFTGGRGYFIKELTCRLVSHTTEHPINVFSAMPVKRVGVEFESVTLPQQVQINSLIKYHNNKTQAENNRAGSAI